MKFKTEDIQFGYDDLYNQHVMSCTVPESDIQALEKVLSKEGIKSIEVKGKSNRTLTSNAALWLLLNEIAKKLRTSKDELYLEMLDRYGKFTHVIVKPEAVDRIKNEWRTVRELGEVSVNGKQGIQLQCYYGSSGYDKQEFSVLLDGVISEAAELDIRLISQEERNSYINNMEV